MGGVSALVLLLVITLATYGGTMRAPATVNAGATLLPSTLPEPWKSDLCYPYACPKYTLVSDLPGYQTRKYPAGKWLKIKTKPFQLWNMHFQEIVDYISGHNSRKENMTGAVPFLVQVDLPAGHEHLHQVYMDEMAVIEKLLKQRADNLNRLFTSSQVQTRANFIKIRADAIRNEFMSQAGVAEKNFLKDMKMTVYNYLHEKHSTNPPAPINPNLSIVDSLGFDVYAMSFRSLLGRAVSYEHAKNTSRLINTPLKTYYLADYMQQIYRFPPYTFEIWLPLDSNRPIL